MSDYAVLVLWTILIAVAGVTFISQTIGLPT